MADGEAPEAASIRGQALEALELHLTDQQDEALARVVELARAHPGSALALNLAGYLHRHAGFLAWNDSPPGDAEAASALDSYSRHHRAALDAFSAAARLAPDCVMTALAHAETLADCNRYEDARAELFRVLSKAEADHADPAIHNVAYDLNRVFTEKARKRDAVAKASLAMERFLAKINTEIIPKEVVKLLDANDLGGRAAAEARDRAKLLAETYPYSARAQLLSGYIDLAPLRAHDTAMDKKQLLRRALSTVSQAAANFDSSLVVALFHAKLLFFLGEYDAAERECCRALRIKKPNDPNFDDIPPIAVLGEDFDDRVCSIKKQLRVLLKQIIDVAALCWTSIESTPQGKRIISVRIDTLLKHYDGINKSAAKTTEYLELPPIDVHENVAGRIAEVELDRKGISGQSLKEMENNSSCQQNLSVFNKNSADKELCILSATVQHPVEIDYLTNLSEDTILLILSRVEDTELVAQISILSRYLRNLWVKLSDLYLSPGRVCAALSAYEALQGSGIRQLNVRDPVPTRVKLDATASWLWFAESRVSEEIIFHNRCEDALPTELLEDDMVDGGTFELPCITKTRSVRLSLGNLELTLPTSGIFSSLTVLFLENFRFQGQIRINSAMFPSLLYLTMKGAQEMVALEVKTDTLSQLELLDVQGFERLVVNAKALKLLTIQVCFLDATAPVANIAAESLQELRWQDLYDENTVSLGPMPGLHLIAAPAISNDWHEQLRWDQICANFLKNFSAIETLELQLNLEANAEIPESSQQMDGSPLFMEAIRIPNTEILRLALCTDGHYFGGSVLQLLSRCTGIKALVLTLDVENTGPCPQDCTCRQTSWRSQDFTMTALKKAEIQNFSGAEHEVNFVEQLLSHSPGLESVTTEWNGSVGTIRREVKSDSEEDSEPG